MTVSGMPRPALLPPAALGALIQLWRKYDYTNVLAAAVAVAHITRINPTTLNTYDDVLLLINGVYKPTQITPHCGLSSDLTVLAREHGITAALPACHVLPHTCSWQYQLTGESVTYSFSLTPITSW
jgi:hypothetical protein